MANKFLLAFVVFLFCLSYVSAETLYVSQNGSGANPTTWAGAWQNLTGIVWGAGANKVSAGDILVLDRGRYNERLAITINGSYNAPVNMSLISMTTAQWANLGLIVITTGNSGMNNLTNETLITRSNITGKVIEGLNNTGWINTNAMTTVSNISYNNSAGIVTIWECTTNVTALNGCLNMTLVTNITNVNNTNGSFYYNTSSRQLYAHSHYTGNITNSQYDLEVVDAYAVPLAAVDMTSVRDFAFDGGNTSNFRISFGDANSANGIIKTNDINGTLIFRNMKMIYTDNVSHFAHLRDSDLIIANSIIGKSFGLHGITWSQRNVTGRAFIVNNTIWDGWTSHGGSTFVDPVETLMFMNNTWRVELGNSYTGGLINLDSLTLFNGVISFVNNTFQDADVLWAPQVDSYYINFFTGENFNNTNGSVYFGYNNFTVVPSYNANYGNFAYLLRFRFLNFLMENNTFANFDGGASNTVMTLSDNITNGILRSNTFYNDIQPINLISTTSLFSMKNFTIYKNYFNVTNNAGSHALVVTSNAVNDLTFDSNTMYASPTASWNFQFQDAIGNITLQNNYIWGAGGGLITLGESSNLFPSYNFYNNVFDTVTAPVWFYNYDGGTGQVVGNDFYKCGAGGGVDVYLDPLADTTSNIRVEDNIFSNSTTGSAIRNSAPSATIGANYNIFYGNNVDNGSFALGYGNKLNTDPKWGNPDVQNFSLKNMSKAIDSSNSTNQLATDYLGNGRVDTIIPNNGTGTFTYYDIGAFEYQSLLPVISITSIQTIPASHVVTVNTVTTGTVCFYSIYNDTPTVDPGNSNVTFACNVQFMPTVTGGNENYTIFVYANDSQGNQGFDVGTFTLTGITPPAVVTECSSGTKSVLSLITLFFAISLVLIIYWYIQKRGGWYALEMKDIVMIALVIIIGSAFIVPIAQSVGSVCI